MEAINRTTLGVRVPLGLQQQIEDALLLIKRKPGVTDVRWNAPSELILSLCSLGELSPATIARVGQAALEVCRKNPRLRLDVVGFGGLPNMIQPRYVYAGIGGDAAALGTLVTSLDQALSPLLPYRDVKPFHPDILLGRLKTESEPNRVGLGRALKLAQQPMIGTLDVSSVELLIASASTTGIGYSVVESLALG